MWGKFACAGLIRFGDLYAPGALPITWLHLPNMGPLGGVSGTEACDRCGAWRFPKEQLRCCLPHPEDPTTAAFTPPEVDMEASGELYDLQCLFDGNNELAKHFRRHAHLFNAAHSYASLKRLAKQTPLSGVRSKHNAEPPITYYLGSNWRIN